MANLIVQGTVQVKCRADKKSAVIYITPAKDFALKVGKTVYLVLRHKLPEKKKEARLYGPTDRFKTSDRRVIDLLTDAAVRATNVELKVDTDDDSIISVTLPANPASGVT